MTVSELANKLGLTRQGIDKAIRRAGVVPKMREVAGVKWRILTKKQANQIEKVVRKK